MKNQDQTGLNVKLRKLERVVVLVSKCAEQVAGAACLLTLGVICYTVVMRYFFNRPPIWNEEIAGWLVVAVVMLAIPEAQRRGENIGVEILSDKYPALRRPLMLLGFVCVGVTAFLFLDEGMTTVRFSHLLGLVSNTLPTVSLWTVQILIPVGGALLLLVALMQIVLWCKGLLPRDFEDKDMPGISEHE